MPSTDIHQSDLCLKFTLTRHTKAVNALAVSPQGSMLLSGGNDSRVVLWNLISGEMIQEYCVPSAGFVSCLAWVNLSNEEDAFVFGASDGNIHLYARGKDSPLFAFCSVTLAHEGTIESVAWDSIHRRLASVGNGEVRLWKVGDEAKSFVQLTIDAEKQPYVARAVHFCDSGSSLLVSYLESGFVFCFTIDPWQLKWKKKANGRIGSACFDGQQLLICNLRDGVDRYALPTMHRAQSYHHTILTNVPFQISVTRESGWVVVGGDNGFARIFDYQLGTFREKLDHGSAGDLIIAVTAYDGPKGCTIVTGSALDGHSSVKVWGQRNEVRSSQTSLPFTATPHGRTGVSIKQMIIFAFICIIVNLAMRYLPSSIPDDIDIAVMTRDLLRS
ncbi:WD40-repeat-containing domain protein [Boletus reticuloceps]|uniref:WD40-repeat-containing domain protein n=1 Tax=Boletus reticuloceps TaxID=495285 RepID=A0A8I2YZX7_9AGAM|nr:WD40-repeat-containing domain protein [Boletus reticuloceps]